MEVHASPQQAKTRPLGGQRVLVAESVLRSRETLTDAVRGLGARDLVCADFGSAALEELRSTRYDLVIVGQVYGDGYDASLLLERIREERLIPPAGTLIAISAERSSRTVTALAAHGPDACILRPFSAGRFRERLLQIVAHKRHLQEATGRSGFSLKRLRQAGEVATRGGDLALAERVLDRVVGKVHDSDLTRSSDYVNLVEVLAARGKLNRADRVADQLRSAHSADPDSMLVGPLLAWRRATGEATPVTVQQAFEALLDAYERTGHEASMEMKMQVLEACVDQGAREDAYALARSLASAGVADRLALKRVRQLLDRLSH